ncbi:MAG: glycoside hydrolase family 75 protein [Candidatus Sulfotelmatobacter sp.]
MRKQVIHRILFSALLCGSGFAQSLQISGEAQFSNMQSSYQSFEWNAVTGNFERPERNAAVPRALEGRANSCATVRSRLLDISARDRDGEHFSEVPIWRLQDSRAVFFVSGMTIDADGAPNAYDPDDTGLDELVNAGTPTHWDGIVTDRDGNPLIQQESDPFPGYYISCTSLSDKTKKFTDPTGYVDASKIPYVAVPQDVADRGGARLGDFAVVINLRNGKSSFAIYADIGTLGEGSVALADALGIRSDARHGGEHGGILYLLFPGSGNLQPRTIGEIQSEGERLSLDQRGEIKELSSCVESNDVDGNEELLGVLRPDLGYSVWH